MAIQSLLICVGSELLRGKVNTHASTLARRLLSVGVELAQEQTVADDVNALTQAIRQGLGTFPLVFVTGGLGPTFDDVSREAAASATQCPLERSPKILQELTTKFRKARYKKMPPMNARQADVLRGARVIPNGFGTAPGQWLQRQWKVESEVWRVKDKGLLPLTFHPLQTLVLLPGPPRELKPMLEEFVIPELRKAYKARPRAEGHLHFVGIPESLADQKIRPIIKRYEKKSGLHVDFTILAHLGLVDFDVFVEAASPRLAHSAMQAIVSAIQKRLKNFCYGLNDNYPLEKVVGHLLGQHKKTLSVAESCTGGLLAAQLTEIAGSSDYFLGGVVAYANRIKENQLGVAADMLRHKGAVSAEVAVAMAQGIRARLHSDYGIGITGIAGPGGGTPEKPVGLVFIALSTPRQTVVKEFRFSSARDVVRQRATTAALEMLYHALRVWKK